MVLGYFEKVFVEKYQIGLVVAVGDFLSYHNLQLLKFGEDKRLKASFILRNKYFRFFSSTKNSIICSSAIFIGETILKYIWSSIGKNLDT